MSDNVIVCTQSFLGKLKNHDDEQCWGFRYVLSLNPIPHFQVSCKSPSFRCINVIA